MTGEFRKTTKDVIPMANRLRSIAQKVQLIALELEKRNREKITLLETLKSGIVESSESEEHRP